MRKSEAAEFRRFLYNESCRLEELSVIKWNHIFTMRRFDTLDLLDLIELSSQIEYLNYLEQRVGILLDYLCEPY